ncbi:MULTISPECIES: sensor histidine kinase [Bacillus]|uniref:sensor histidine kinase n=1 Tax=Bacillus TaxID=1386 RepID=UPI000366047E|nr:MULTISPECIES: sensor histidine kinase [Bacillus]AIK38029.1 histidine kinase-, DNA gyrase B-, and HSP90-like ATPase family protein [Bacillus pseudomycoides]AJI17029.1 histidine kinase-, DNA gyrase B-, and HSP90-like ATPase family protein [Bacillus pseudomycoides]MCR8858812.1 sensor histidine kinase [Bacillus pseudomycoides]MEB3053060.1 sensor histidine kinase [Bacillus pseudomycoides]PEB40175.1 sensor histidine kinase [Bacillus pseudomycoides]
MIKLFIREHIPLLCFTIFQFIAIFLVYWFDGYRHMTTALYAMFLGLCFLIAYLLYRYFTHKSFYERLANPLRSLDESVQKSDFAVLSTALHELLEVQYRHYQNQLQVQERKNEEHLTFMNQWIHQMKTPLSVIELLTQDEVDPRFESINEEADKLKKGLEMALYVARLETFTQDFYVERVQLYKLVNEAIHEHKRFFIRNFVYPEVKIEKDIIVESDAKWLQFLVGQILSNAIKYSTGSREKIILKAYNVDKRVILEVSDFGVGIPKQDIPRVFQPFFTGENGRDFKESTGMGLYLVHEIAKHLGHKVEIYSEVKKGTTVRIIFYTL